MKHKNDKIDGYDPWEIEIAYLVDYLEAEPIDARAIVICSWMHRGDLRPLAAEINRKGTAIDGAILSELARIIEEGKLTVKRKRGAPKQPATSARDLWIAICHANRDGKSADAIQTLVEQRHVSEELVRRAIRRRPKLTN